MKNEEVGRTDKSCNQVKGCNFSSTSSMIGDSSRTCAKEGGRLHFMLPEKMLLAAVEEEVNDDMEVQ